MRINKTTLFSNVIKLGELNDVPKTIQILRVGKFNHPQYGNFEITPLTLQEMKRHFDERVRGIDISFDYYHESNEDASAWVRGLELQAGGTELWANVDWTPKATQKLADRELRYFSPDFAFNWTDPETGVTFSNVLFGGGLTNRPFVKEMQAIVADEKLKGDTMTELEKAQKELKELNAQNVKLSEDKMAMEKKMADMVPAPAPGASSELEALKKENAELKQMLEKMKSEQDVLMVEKKKADEAKMLAEKETAFNLLLSEGKAVAAQKAAFVKGDMNEFIKLAQPVNTKGAGSSENQNQSTDETTAKIIKLAEEKRKANPRLDQGQAISMAKKEIEAQK